MHLPRDPENRATLSFLSVVLRLAFLTWNRRLTHTNIHTCMHTYIHTHIHTHARAHAGFIGLDVAVSHKQDPYIHISMGI